MRLDWKVALINDIIQEEPNSPLFEVLPSIYADDELCQPAMEALVVLLETEGMSRLNILMAAAVLGDKERVYDAIIQIMKFEEKSPHEVQAFKSAFSYTTSPEVTEILLDYFDSFCSDNDLEYFITSLKELGRINVDKLKVILEHPSTPDKSAWINSVFLNIFCCSKLPKNPEQILLMLSSDPAFDPSFSSCYATDMARYLLKHTDIIVKLIDLTQIDWSARGNTFLFQAGNCLELYGKSTQSLVHALLQDRRVRRKLLLQLFDDLVQPLPRTDAKRLASNFFHVCQHPILHGIKQIVREWRDREPRCEYIQRLWNAVASEIDELKPFVDLPKPKGMLKSYDEDGYEIFTVYFPSELCDQAIAQMQDYPAVKRMLEYAQVVFGMYAYHTESREVESAKFDAALAMWCCFLEFL